MASKMVLCLIGFRKANLPNIGHAVFDWLLSCCLFVCLFYLREDLQRAQNRCIDIMNLCRDSLVSFVSKVAGICRRVLESTID